MYGFLYLDVLHIHTAIVRRTNICLASFIWMYCISYNCKDNKHMYGFLYLDVLHVHTAIVRRINIRRINIYGFLYLDVLHIHTAIVRRTNICMASFIWMYCMFIQQL